MIKREDTFGVVYRKVSEDLRVTTVFGKKEVPVKLCLCCLENLPLSSFYLESKSTRKYPNQTRKYCVVCWDKYNGKKVSLIDQTPVPRVRSEPTEVGSTLDTFFVEESVDVNAS